MSVSNHRTDHKCGGPGVTWPSVVWITASENCCVCVAGWKSTKTWSAAAAEQRLYCSSLFPQSIQQTANLHVSRGDWALNHDAVVILETVTLYNVAALLTNTSVKSLEDACQTGDCRCLQMGLNQSWLNGLRFNGLKTGKGNKKNRKTSSYSRIVTQKAASISLLDISHQFYHHMFSAESFLWDYLVHKCLGLLLFMFVQPKLSLLWHSCR